MNQFPDQSAHRHRLPTLLCLLLLWPATTQAFFCLLDRNDQRHRLPPPSSMARKPLRPAALPAMDPLPQPRVDGYLGRRLAPTAPVAAQPEQPLRAPHWRPSK